MFRRRKLAVVAAAAGSLLALGVAAAPRSALADQCVVTVTLVDGRTLTFNVNVPPGTPVSAMKLPITGTVASANESCLPASTTSTASTSTTASSTSTTASSTSTTASTTSTTASSTSTTASSTSTTASSTSTTAPSTGTTAPSTSTTAPSTGTTAPSTTTSTTSTTASPKAHRTHARPPKPRGAGTVQRASSHRAPARASKRQKKASKPTTTKPAKPSKPATPKLSGAGGVPAASNPSYSFSAPGAAQIGVPNFFIDNFEIPPFLLPIYQAAGIQYDVPWQVLAAINEIETDYGRNLSVSTAGAVGWMQFLPSTWQHYGLDATDSGYADPYNPVDAIFAAAQYLHAAGASTNLANAIYAYNHAWWYVQSVLLRAQLIGGMPPALIGSLTSLVEGHFPVAAPAKYADDNVEQLAKTQVKGANAAVAISTNPGTTGTSIYAKQGSPVIAINDGKIVKVGDSQQLGNYIELQDSNGNVYTYAQLGSVPKQYPVPRPVRLTAANATKELSASAAPAPKGPATAGSQPSTPTVSTAQASKEAKSGPITLPVTPAPATQPQVTAPLQPQVTAPLVKERLFANPSRPASYAAGGDLQLHNAAQQITNFQNYFSDVLHLGRNQYTLQPLKAGAIVVAGTILGRLGPPTATEASHVFFTIRPAGKNAPLIDPKPILDGWKLLEATAVYRAAGINPFVGKNPTIGQILLMSKEQLQTRVLQDPHVQIYTCGRRDIQAGLIDRRILAVVEFLSASGLDPYVSGLECGHSLTATTGVDAAGATGSSLDISKINNIPIEGHQGAGSITDITIRRLLTLQGTFKPDQIISLMSYKGQSNTRSLPDHANRIQVTYTPQFGANKQLSAEVANILQPGQWVQLINRISQIPEPVVPIAPSKYAIVAPAGG